METDFNWEKVVTIAVVGFIGAVLIWTIIIPVLAFQYIRDVIDE